MNRPPLHHFTDDQLEAARTTGSLSIPVAWPCLAMGECPADAEICPEGEGATFPVVGLPERVMLFTLTIPLAIGPIRLGLSERRGKALFGGPALFSATCLSVAPKRVRLCSPERPRPFTPARWAWIYQLADLAPIDTPVFPRGNKNGLRNA